MLAGLRRFLSVPWDECRRPYFLVSVAVLAVWIAVALDSSLLGFDLLGSLWEDAQLKGAGATPILLYATYPASVALFGFAVYRLRAERLLSLYYAASAPILAIVLFEDLWHLFGGFAPTFPAHLKDVNAAGFLILGTWTAYGAITVRFWTFGRLQGIGFAGYLVGWSAWFLAGYPQVAGGSEVAFAFNLGLKWLSFAVVALLLVPRPVGSGAATRARAGDLK